MPVIRVSDDTWERLQKWAVPLTGSAEDAARRVLDVAESQALPAPPRAWLEMQLRMSLRDQGVKVGRARAMAKRVTQAILDDWGKEVEGMRR